MRTYIKNLGITLMAMGLCFGMEDIGHTLPAPQEGNKGIGTTMKKATPSVNVDYGKIPLYFIQNDGQVDGKVKFYEKGSGHATYFTNDGVFLVLNQETSLENENKSKRSLPTKTSIESQTYDSEFIKLMFINANADPEVLAEGLQEGKVNYLIGNDRKKWRTNVPSYEAVVYKEVYPGIDIKFYGNNQKMEYDIIVKPGAKPSKVRLAYEGVEGLQVTEKGDLEIVLGKKKILQKKPYVFQDIDGKRVEVVGTFKIDSETNSFPNRYTYGFEVSSYDKNQPLIIDPVLIYSTYLGGVSTVDAAQFISVDSNGNAYVAGITAVSTFPIANAFQPIHGGVRDVFVSKFSPSGGLIYSTYLGGSNNDYPMDLVVDDFGNSHVIGYTWSTNFPTSNPIQVAHGGGSVDAFATKLNSTGSALVYSTYLGGTDNDTGHSGSLDSLGNLYIIGATHSTNFPTASAFQPVIGGWSDAFITQIDSGGALGYSTYLGGSGYVRPDFPSHGDKFSITADSSGNVYIAGETSSTDFPTLNAAQNTSGGSLDIFAAHFNPVGGLVYSTYLGGSEDERQRVLIVDSNGNAYHGGSTISSDFPTVNAFDGSFNGQSDAFVTKLNPSGSFIYSTFLGGALGDAAYAFAVDLSSNLYVGGTTSSSNFPVLNAFQPIHGGFSDAFISKFDTVGALLFSTFLGGSLDDSIGFERQMVIDNSDNIYFSGSSNSTDFPTLNAVQPTFGGGLVNGPDAIVVKFDSLGTLIFSTYLGGSHFDFGQDIAVDSSGRVYVSGRTQSSDFPLANAIQSITSHAGFVAKVDIEATPSADISVSMQDSPDPVKVGVNLTYTVTVTNLGPHQANDVEVTNTLPPEVSFLSAIPSKGNCSETSGSLTCDLGGIATGSSETVTIVVIPNTVGNLSNTVIVTGGESDPDLSNNTVTENTTVDPASTDLSIIKTDSPDPVNVGVNLTYTITVTNFGPSIANGVTVTDTLSGGVNYVSATPSQGSCSEAGGTVTCNLGSLTNGANATITVFVTPTATGILSNTGCVLGIEPDPNSGNDCSTSTTTVNPASADLSITKTDSPDPVVVGNNLTYIVTVTNNGPSNATGVTVTDTLPGGVNYVSSTPSQGSCSEGGGTVTCNLGSLTNGANATVTIVVSPTATGILTNTACVTGNEPDPNPGNDCSTSITTVNPASADLSISKTDSPDPVLAGQSLTYTLSVTNNGTSTATQVTVTDTLPSGAMFVSASGSGWMCSQAGGVVTCTRASLAVGPAPAITITVTPTAMGTISNTACVTGNEPDPNSGNDCSTATTTVNSPPSSADLSITKTDVPDPVERQSDLTYTMVVTNNGSLNATGVTLSDTLPGNIILRSISTTQGTCTSSGSLVTCTIGSLANGASATVTIVVRPKSTGTLTNTASVTGNESDSIPGNNSISVSTSVVTSAADLSVTKSDSPDPVTVGNSLSYTMVVSNNGPSRADGVTLTDTLPGGVTYVNAWSTRGNCSESGGTVTCNIGRLRDGRTETVTIVVDPTGTGTLSNTACVSSSEADPNPGNDCATETTTVEPPSINTPVGNNVPVDLGNGVTLTFSNVSAAGETTINIVTTGSPPPTSFRLGRQNIYYDVNTTATFSGPVTICFDYDDSQFSREDKLKLFHFEGSGWTDVTDSLDTDTNAICGTTTSLSPFIVVEPDLPDLSNISTRAFVGMGANVEIGGFIIEGSSPKRVMIRGRGPSMSGEPFYITGTLFDPYLKVYSFSAGIFIAQNDDWQTQDPLCAEPAEDCEDVSGILSTGLDPCIPNPGITTPPPGCVREAAVLITLPPGQYGAIMNGVNNGTGVGLMEVFEMDATPPILENISTRAFVGVGDNMEIGGLIIEGSEPKTVLIRGRGPSMSGQPFNISGTLSNPFVRVYSFASGTYIAQNDDWQTSDPLCPSSGYACGGETEIIATGLDPCIPNPGESTAPSGCANESAVLITLPPGQYGAIVSGVNNGTGVGLVEVFEVD